MFCLLFQSMNRRSRTLELRSRSISTVVHVRCPPYFFSNPTHPPCAFEADGGADKRQLDVPVSWVLPEDWGAVDATGLAISTVRIRQSVVDGQIGIIFLGDGDKYFVCIGHITDDIQGVRTGVIGRS